MIRPVTFEMTLKRVRMSDRVPGVPEECWVISCERPSEEARKVDGDQRNRIGPSGGNV